MQGESEISRRKLWWDGITQVGLSTTSNLWGSSAENLPITLASEDNMLAAEEHCWELDVRSPPQDSYCHCLHCSLGSAGETLVRGERAEALSNWKM